MDPQFCQGCKYSEDDEKEELCRRRCFVWIRPDKASWHYKPIQEEKKW